MEHIGIDVHKKESPICLLAEGGEVIERRIRTEGERFAAALTWLRARMLIEASTDPRLDGPVSRTCAHQVIVADPKFAPV